jgi:hypothetical protein
MEVPSSDRQTPEHVGNQEPFLIAESCYCNYIRLVCQASTLPTIGLAEILCRLYEHSSGPWHSNDPTFLLAWRLWQNDCGCDGGSLASLSDLEGFD